MTLSNRWIHPNSNQHRTLMLLRTEAREESDVCMTLGLTQGYNAATIFNFAYDYSLVDYKGKRSCGKLNTRGEMVLGYLGEGFSVNLRDLKLSKAKAAKAAEKSFMERLRISYGDAKHRILRYLSKNPGEVKVGDIKSGSNVTQANKAAIQLGNAELVVVTKRGRSTFAEITELGKQVYANEIEPGEFAHYEEANMRSVVSTANIVESNLKSLNSIFANYNDITHLAYAMTDRYSPWGVDFGYTFARVEQAQRDMIDHIRAQSEMINEVLQDHEFYSMATSQILDRLIESITTLRNNGVRIDLDNGLGDFLMMKKLSL